MIRRPGSRAALVALPVAVAVLAMLAPAASAQRRSDVEAQATETYISQVLQPLMQCFTGGFNQINSIRDPSAARSVDQGLERCYSRAVSGGPEAPDGQAGGLRTEMLGKIRDLRQRIADISRAMGNLARFDQTSTLSRERPLPGIPSAFESARDNLLIDVQNARTNAINMGADFQDFERRFQAWVQAKRDLVRQLQQQEYDEQRLPPRD